ncbi:Vacuolar protein 8 [Liparis tanakae]|uniref:Vacuolar protein 8 n=1 Tax=Liparis tanakae TaxID=230148 RepID=A0A4Z2FUK1_9TELE|nr:Vacuolar protein 8 [Liparis tanakae]
MASGFCENCCRQLKNILVYLRKVCREFEQKLRDVFRELSQCTCFRNTPESRFLRRKTHDSSSLHLLCVKSPLPDAFMEPVMALLLSPDLDVQKTITLSLVNLLAKNKVCKELVIEMGTLVPLLELFRSTDAAARCHACACVTLLASSEPRSEAVMVDGIMPLLALAKSYEPQEQQNATWALLHLTQSVLIQEQLMELDCVLPLKALLKKSSPAWRESAVMLLSSLSAHPPNNDVLVSEGLLDDIGQLLHHPTSVIITHGCRIISDLCLSSAGQQAATESPCVPGLLGALLSPSLSGETSLRVTSCLHQLMTCDALKSKLSATITSEQVSRLVKMSGQTLNPQLSHDSASIIGSLEMTEDTVRFLRPHYVTVLDFLSAFLKSKDVEWQQLAVVTVSNLEKDGGFSSLLAGSVLEAELQEVQTPTGETRRMLHAIEPLSPPSIHP